jgi:hypothetical protein
LENLRDSKKHNVRKNIAQRIFALCGNISRNFQTKGTKNKLKRPAARFGEPNLVWSVWELTENPSKS